MTKAPSIKTAEQREISPFTRITPKKLTQAIGAAVLSSLMAASAWAEVGNPRVNQVGYLPNSAKVASYKTNSIVALPWELRRNGAVIASGSTMPKGTDAASGDNIHHIDISNVSTEGTGYKLYVAGDESYAFDIAADAFTGALYDSIKYFYHNRSGIAIETPYTGGGNTSYAPDAKWSRPAGHINVGANKGDYNVPCWSGTCSYSLDVPKGWYDAGDHGKYVVNGGISVWKLLTMYERALHLSDSADAFADNTLNIPESGNGVPDILDEVRWQMEFMLAMQVPQGQPKAGMVHHKMHDVGWTGLPLAPHEDPQNRALVPPSTAATLNVAATGAQCARLWQNIDSAFASQCLTAAERAWDAAQQNPNDLYTGGYDNGGGGYGDRFVADEFFWAAAELYITTGDSKYLPTINNYEIERTDFAWPDTELPGLISLATVPVSHTASLRTSARQKIVEIADFHMSVIDSTGYLTPHTAEEYYWGSNNGVTNKLFLVGLAYDFTGNDNYAKAVGKAVDYLFGRNPMSFSYISGHGENALTQPHHRFWAGALNSAYPWLPPGAFSGGPNAGLEDEVAQGALNGCQTRPATCFMDDINSWSTNEITINWNSALAWVLAFYDDYGNGAETPNTPPVAVLTQSKTEVWGPTDTVQFYATDSSDADGDELTYNWVIEGVFETTGELISVFFNLSDWQPNETERDLAVTLTVSDGNGGSDTATTTIKVYRYPQNSSSSMSSVGSSSSAPLSSSSSSLSSSSVSSISSSAPVSSSSSSSSTPGIQQCNWYGTLYPLCVTTQSGWGWEQNRSCISRSTCSSQPAPWGIVGGTTSSSSSRPASSSSSSSLISSSARSSSSSAISSSAASSSSVAGGSSCQYVVTNQWNNGFTGAIRITNNGSSAINSWNVSWSYSDGSRITNSWNANLSGSNPYNASNLGWNGTIQPGQTAEFGFQGTKGASAATVPVVSGTPCN
jgi:endoglucanase